MNPFSKDIREMTLDEMLAELAWSDSGELTRWNLEHRDLPGMIFKCCEELQRLSCKVEVIGWLPALDGEALGRDFYRGVSDMADDVRHRITVVEAIIRKATTEMRKEVES